MGPSELSWGHPPGFSPWPGHISGPPKSELAHNENIALYHTYTPYFPASSSGVRAEGTVAPRCTGRGNLPKVTQPAKIDLGCHVTTLPPPCSSNWPTLFPVARSEPGIQEALNSCSCIAFSRGSCSGLGNQVRREKAEVTGGGPILGHVAPVRQE